MQTNIMKLKSTKILGMGEGGQLRGGAVEGDVCFEETF